MPGKIQRYGRVNGIVCEEIFGTDDYRCKISSLTQGKDTVRVEDVNIDFLQGTGNMRLDDKDLQMHNINEGTCTAVMGETLSCTVEEL